MAVSPGQFVALQASCALKGTLNMLGTEFLQVLLKCSEPPFATVMSILYSLLLSVNEGKINFYSDDANNWLKCTNLHGVSKNFYKT